MGVYDQLLYLTTFAPRENTPIIHWIGGLDKAQSQL